MILFPSLWNLHERSRKIQPTQLTLTLTSETDACVYRKTCSSWRYACSVAEDLCYHSALWIVHTVLLGTAEDMADVIAVFQKIKANASELD